MTTLRFGALDSRHRARLAEILDATAVFSREEVDVALALFDETFDGRAPRVEGRDCAGPSLDPGVFPTAAARPSTLDPRPSSYQFLGAFAEDDTLAGYACYGATPGTEGTFDLYWIAVDPSTQGRGAGTHLLGEVERRLRVGDGRLLIAETSSRAAYEATRRFYERRGYSEQARVAAFYGPGDDRVIYAKRLRPRGDDASQGPPLSTSN